MLFVGLVQVGEYCCDVTHLLHDHVLAFSIVAPLGLNDCLQELEVLHMFAMRLNEMYKMLHNPLSDLVTEGDIVFEDGTHCLGLQQLIIGNIRGISSSCLAIQDSSGTPLAQIILYASSIDAK